MIYGPIPYWLQTVATIFSFLLFVPVLSAVTNFFGTIRGEWHQLRTNVPLKFIIAGTIFYLLVSTQGSFQALRALNAVTHFTDWVIGHSHMAMFGFVTFYAFAGCYYAVPRMYKRPLVLRRHGRLAFLAVVLRLHPVQHRPVDRRLQSGHGVEQPQPAVYQHGQRHEAVLARPRRAGPR